MSVSVKTGLRPMSSEPGPQKSGYLNEREGWLVVSMEGKEGRTPNT